jgi:DNA-binding transcriptional LysR family regulator
MKLNKLAIYQIVCQEMNMTRAGKILNMSQPAISNVIKEIEGHYKVSVFERISGKLYLTLEGKKLLEYTDEIMDLHDKIEEGMEELISTKTIRVGISHSLSNIYLDKLSSMEIPKNIKIKSYINSKSEIERLLLSSEVDIAMVIDNPNSDDIISEMIKEFKYITIASIYSPLSKLKNINNSQLVKERFLIREKGSGIRNAWSKTLRASLKDIDQVGEFASEEVILRAVKRNMGFAILPDFIEYGKGITEFDNLLDLPCGQIHIAYHRDKILSDNLIKLKNILGSINLK